MSQTSGFWQPKFKQQNSDGKVNGALSVILTPLRLIPPATIDFAKGLTAVSQRFKSIWDAIEDEPAAMKARAEVMAAIADVVSGWHLTQAEASEKLRITQPRLNDLLRGHINKFSLDSLVILAERSGLSVQVKISARRKPKRNKFA